MLCEAYTRSCNIADLEGKILTANVEEHRKEAKYYDRIHTEIFNFHEQRRVNKILDRFLRKLNRTSKILEVGCGTGNFTLKLFARGFGNVTCLDISEDMIATLKEKTKSFDHSATFVVADLDSFLAGNKTKFELILMNSVLHHLPHPISSLRQLCQTLNNKGVICAMHEPLPPSKQPILVRFLLKVDFCVYALRYILLIALGRLKYLRRDCGYSDYHTGENAIDLPKVEATFASTCNIEIAGYATAKFGLTAFLLDKLGFHNTFQLSLIADKSKNQPEHKTEQNTS